MDLIYFLKVLFDVPVGDVHCGMRAIKRTVFNSMSVNSHGWEFAQDMVINARINRIRTKELSIHYFKRNGFSKLHTFSDGIRQFFFIFYFIGIYYNHL